MGMGEERKEEEVQVVDITSLDTYHLIGLFVGLLSEQAWRHIGLRMDPRTREVKKDFERARVAIDCVAFLIEKLEPNLGDDEKRRLRTLLTDLQVNFVKQKSEDQTTTPT